MPSMMAGDVLGHEFMGEVVEPFPISCGGCMPCEAELYSCCENSSPNAWLAETMWGHSPAGIFRYSHRVGGYAGGQAQYARVPYADVGPIKVPEGLTDDQALFLSDILPTGWMAAEPADIQPGDTVAVRGCGPDACIDAVGLEAHAGGLHGACDKVKTAMLMENDRPPAIRQALLACRPGGTVSIAGVYGGFVDKIPFGAIVNESLRIRSAQTHVQRYMKPLLERIQRGEIDPTFIVSHRLPLSQAPAAYRMFRDKQDECIKVVLDPWAYGDGAARRAGEDRPAGVH